MRSLDVIQLVKDAAMTGTTVVTGAAVGMSKHKSCAFQFVWTGTPNGSFAIEGSVDGTNWSSLAVERNSSLVMLRVA